VGAGKKKSTTVLHRFLLFLSGRVSWPEEGKKKPPLCSDAPTRERTGSEKGKKGGEGGPDPSGLVSA